VDDRVAIGDVNWFDGRRPWTVEIWINSGPFRGSLDRIISDEDVGQEPLELIRHSTANNLHLHLRQEGGTFFMGTLTSFTPNSWEHIVHTYDGTNLCVYRNGIIVGTCSSSTLAPGTNPGILTFGSRSGGGNHWNGMLDEIRIYTAAMPVSYIQKRYVEGIKSLANNGGITQEEKQERLTALRNSGQLVINLDAALAGEIDFSVYDKYLALKLSE
jgi:hypothetical protein